MKKILLSLLLVAPIGIYAQCTELFFSEYSEGSGNNKAMEIYNPTPNSINLAGYVLQRFANGSAVVSDSLVLVGTIAAHDVFVVVNGQTTSTPTSPACDPLLQAMADQLDGVYPAPTYMNGNDAMALTHNDNLIDILGKIGEDPVISWTDVFPYTSAAGGTYITKDHTMIRKSNITQGVTVNPSAFNPLAEYDTLPVNTWTNLGIHVCTCNTSGIAEQGLPTVAIYPNPAYSKQLITVSSSTVINSVEFYTMDGKKAKTINFEAKSKLVSLNVSDLDKNMYLIKTYTVGRHPATTKIEIQ